MKKLMLGVGAVALLIIVLFILVLSSNRSNNEEITTITLKTKSEELTAGEKIKLEVIDKKIDPKNDLLWYSDNTRVATVDQNTGEVTAINSGKATITVKYKKDKSILDKCTITVTRQTSVITLDKTSITLNVDESKTVVATVTPKKDGEIIWETDDNNIATVDNEGVVTGVSEGKTTLTAKIEGGKTASCDIEVVIPKIEIEELSFENEELKISQREYKKIVPRITPDDASNKTVTWKSYDEEIVTITETGVIYGVAKGETEIVATSSNEKTAKIKVVVEEANDPATEVESIYLDRDSATMYVDESFELNYVVSPDNITDYEITWFTSNSEVATVSTTGEVEAIGVGEATITAKISDEIYATCEVKVIEKVSEIIPVTSISIDTSEETMEIGDNIWLYAEVYPSNATQRNLKWTSSNTSVATVSQNGEVLALASGTAVITATSNNGISASTTIKVNKGQTTNIPVIKVIISKTSTSLHVNESEQLSVVLNPSNATDKSIIWSSSNASVATVSQDGYVTALKEGTAVITARSSSGRYNTCNVTVIKKGTAKIPVLSVKLNYTSKSIEVNKTVTLTATITPSNATDKTITWTSSNPNVASVTNKGVVTGLKKGTVTITARSSSGAASTSKITVTSNSDQPCTSCSGETKVPSADILSSYVKIKGVEKAQIAVFANGKVTSVSNYNTNANERFYVASASKTILGIIAAKMEEEKLISLDTNVANYWYKLHNVNFNSCTSDWRSYIGSEKSTRDYTDKSKKKLVENPATIRNCLTHSSTIKNLSMIWMVPGDTSSEYFGGGLSKSYGRAAFMLAHTSHQLFEQGGKPGSKTEYNYLKDNTTRDHVLAAFTMQIAMKESLNEYATKKLLNPVGSTSAPYFQRGNSIYFATSYQSSAQDLAKLISAVANDGVYDGKRILSTSAVNNLEKVQTGLKNQTIAFDYINGKYVKYGNYSSIAGAEHYKLENVASKFASYISYDPKTGAGFVVTVKYSDSSSKSKSYNTFTNMSNTFYSKVSRDASQYSTVDSMNEDIKLIINTI